MADVPATRGVTDSAVPTAYIVLIGNELLSGKVRDLNGTYAIEALRAHGFETLGMEVIPDEHGRIVETVRRVRAQTRPTLLITSGGIGPTHDDITIAALAEALGRTTVRNAELESRLREYYGDRINDDVLAMAEVPEGAHLSFGSSFFPLIRIEEVAALPGEPTFFRAKIDRIVAEHAGQEPFVTHTLKIARGESTLAAPLRTLQAEFPAVAIGSYPRYDDTVGKWVTLVVLDGRDREQVEAVHKRLVEQLEPEALLEVETD